MKARIADDEYRVRLIDLPSRVKAMTCYSEDGFANIYINAKLSYEQRKRVLMHELGHVARDDANNALPIRLVEESC